jgi:Cu-Zn family superoxide dismutase
MALAAPGDTVSAALSNAEGEPVGSVELTETDNGTLIFADLENLPQGAHGFHIHEAGKCEPPFKSAGGHYNPAGASHGFASPGGSHAGDLPNLQVPESGAVTAEFFKANLKVDDSLLDYGTMENEGAAIVIHAAADDYESDPAGDAGKRIACGVLKGNV